MKFIFAIILFTLIVLVHEFGHFIMAKKNGIDVLEFSLGMGPRIAKFKRKETLYSIKLFPIGGSCLMGEDEEEGDKNPNSFLNKGVYARISTIFAGPFFNFIFAFLCCIFLVGSLGYEVPIITDLTENSTAYQEGLRNDDIIVEYNNHTINLYKEFYFFNTMDTQSSSVDTLHILRDNKEYTLHITPSKDGNLAFNVSPLTENVHGLRVIKGSLLELRYWVTSTLKSVSYLVTGKIGPSALTGPVGIINAIGNSVEDPSGPILPNVGVVMLQWFILLSVNLGIMNLLPLPALDGGRLVFLLIEAVRKKQLDRKLEGSIHTVGFILLMALMIGVFVNDIVKVF